MLIVIQCRGYMIQYILKEFSCKAGIHPCHLFGCALGYNLAAGVTTFRSEVDDPIRSLDHAQVMLDDLKTTYGLADSAPGSAHKCLPESSEAG